jgi:isoquinoline 1-oxidoreductase subunit beta
MTIALSRRAFIQASLSAAGGLAIAAFAPEFAGATTIAGAPWSPEAGKPPDEVNAFVVIDPDNSITLRVAKSDMGQGVLTSMAMIVAEELECDFAKVKVEYASANRNLVDNNVYQSMGTGGSRSVRSSRVYLQQAGASARARLIAAAAAKWSVEPAACVASDSLVRHAASGRSATFGELAADAAKVALAAEPTIKTPDQFKLIGQGVKRIDTPLKVTGSARFGIDTRLPGMAYAAVANCPVFGGKLKSYDFSAISGHRGILAAMPVTNGVAVVADNFWRAKEALNAMPVEWDFGPAGSTDSAQFAAEYHAALNGPLADGGGHGDITQPSPSRPEWSKLCMTFPISRTRRWSRSTRPRIGARTALTCGWARKRRNRGSRSLRKRAASIRRRSLSTIASSAAGSAVAPSTTN